MSTVDDWTGIPRAVRAAAEHAARRGAVVTVTPADVRTATIARVTEEGERLVLDLDGGGAVTVLARGASWATPGFTLTVGDGQSRVIVVDARDEDSVALTLAGYREEGGAWVWRS